MTVQPDKRLEQIEFAEVHWPIWNATPATIGLTAVQVGAIKTATMNARAAYSGAVSARAASKAATLGYHGTTDGMSTLVGEAIKNIRLFAQSTANPTVYQTAQIPPPAAPSPQPPPSQPTDIQAFIEPTGALTLQWRAVSGGDGGAVYLVRRKLVGESSYSIIGAAGTVRGFKTFTDTTLPGGANNIQYIIQGQRGGVVGPDSSVFTVTLGGDGGGIVGISSSVKMAA